MRPIFEPITYDEMIRDGIKALWPDRYDPRHRATIRLLLNMAKSH